MDGSSTKGPQSSSIQSTDHDMTGVDLMTDAEVEDYFEKMLVCSIKKKKKKRKTFCSHINQILSLFALSLFIVR